MPFTDHGSEQPVPPYDNLRAVDWTRLLAEKSQALDHWFYESVQPFVDARCKLIEYYGNVQITVGPSGTKVFHTLPAEVQKLDDELAKSIEWLRQRFNYPANPTADGAERNRQERLTMQDPIAPPAACEASSGAGCSKSESATPLTDAVFAKCKARPTDGSGSRDGGWGAADIADFLWHSRKLEIALGGAVSALRDISGAKAADDVPLYAKSFELLGRIQGIASVALDAISTLNPTGQPPPRLGGGSVAPGCSRPE